MDRTFHEQPCNPSDTVASPKPCNSQNLEGKKPAWCLPLGSASACGLRQGAVNAGGSQAGISGWGTFGGSILYFFQPAILRQTPAPSGYSNASFNSLASESTVVPVFFHMPSLSNRMLPIRRPQGAIT